MHRSERSAGCGKQWKFTAFQIKNPRNVLQPFKSSVVRLRNLLDLFATHVLLCEVLQMSGIVIHSLVVQYDARRLILVESYNRKTDIADVRY